jgi:hypothetical protein
MKHLKTFENINGPQIGDYVLISMKGSYNNDNSIDFFINNNIGQIIKFDENMRLVKYSNVPGNIKMKNKFNKDGSIWIGNAFKTVAFGKTKEELELKMDMKKYNI